MTVIAVSQKKYVDRLIRAAVSRAFHGIPLFPVMSLSCHMSTHVFCVESCVMLHCAPFVFCLDCRKPSRVLTCVLHTVCLTIPCLSEMRRIGTGCCLMFLFLRESITEEEKCKKWIQESSYLHYCKMQMLSTSRLTNLQQ